MAPQRSAHAIGRYRFGKDILRELEACRRTDNWHGPLEIVEHWVVIAAWIWCAQWSWQHLPVLAASVIYAIAVFFIGGRQRALAGVLHQASHGTFMRAGRAGRIIATVFAGYPVLQSYSVYRSSHVLRHHRRLGDPDIDPDYQHYQQSGLCGEHLGPDALRRFLLALAGPRATLSYVAYVARDRIWSPDEDGRERQVRLVFLAALLATCALTGQLVALAVYWVVPLITTQAWLGSLAELLEHYPLVEVAPRVDIYMSRNRQYGALVTFLLGEKAGEKYHLVHHLFPGIPMWRITEAHGILMKDATYASVNQPRAFFLASRSIFTSASRPS